MAPTLFRGHEPLSSRSQGSLGGRKLQAADPAAATIRKGVVGALQDAGLYPPMIGKKTTFRALDRAGVFGALRRLRRAATPILTYHGVLPDGDDTNDYLSSNFVPAAAFERQLRWLLARYRPARLSDVVGALAAGRSLPSTFCVTFDDGFANNYHVAFPILRRLGVPCTIFLATGLIGVAGAQLWTERVKRALLRSARRVVTLQVPEPLSIVLDTPAAAEAAARMVLARLKRTPPAAREPLVVGIEQACGTPQVDARDAIRYDFLNWDQVREMARAGIEFGSHTVSHPILSTLGDAQAEDELRASKRRIEAELGIACRTFAYPNGKDGDFGDRDKRTLKRLGYHCGLVLRGRLNRPGTDLYELDRINVSRSFDDALFSANVTGVLGDARRLKQSVCNWRTPQRRRLASTTGPSKEFHAS